MNTHIQSSEPTPEAGPDKASRKRFPGWKRIIINIKVSEKTARSYLQISPDGTLGDFTITALSYKKALLEEGLGRPQTPLFEAQILEDKWVQDPKYGKMYSVTLQFDPPHSDHFIWMKEATKAPEFVFVIRDSRNVYRDDCLRLQGQGRDARATLLASISRPRARGCDS